jgi:hypothetical protein
MSVDAIMGTFVAIKTMADGTPRVTLDMQCTLSEVAAMGLIPGVPFAIARLSKEAAGKPAVEPVSQPEEPKQKPGQLCVMAVNFCKDPMFWTWIMEAHGLACFNQAEAKEFVLNQCQVESRKELDDLSNAAELFHRLIRRPFLAWRDAQ